MLTLVEIAKKEAETGGVMLIDSSVLDLDSFLEHIGKYEQCSNLNKGLLQKEKQYIEEFLSFIGEKNVFTVKEMLKDFESLDGVISKKQKDFNLSQKKTPKRYKGNKYADQTNQQQLLFRDISDNVSKIVELIKLKIFQPGDMPLYSELYKHLPHCFNEYESLSFLKQDYKKYRELLTSIVYLSMEQKLVTCVVNMFKENMFKEKPVFKEKLEKIIESFKGISILKMGEVVSFSLQPDYIRLYLNNKDGGFLFQYSTKNEKPA